LTNVDISAILISIFFDGRIDVTDVPCCQPLDTPSLPDEDAVAAATLFKALADPARIRLVNLLATSDEPVCACHLIEPLGLSQSTVSHHLKKLTQAGLLEREQRGVWAFYSLNRVALQNLASLVELTEVTA
jgi:ArsR family transcriptional regulator